MINHIPISSEENACVLGMTPSEPVEKTVFPEDLILTPSSPNEQPETADLALEAEDIFRAKEITFEGEEEAEAKIEEAMRAYDKAMDQAAGME